MAFPNTLFPCIPLETEVSDEEFRLFHTIDRKLISTLVHSLRRNSSDAMNVVAFLLWLEKERLSRNAVYKVIEWPIHLINILADQVVALLGWLRNPTLVWEMRGDIYLIQKLCNKDVGFIDLHQRRLEIFEGKKKIMNEICVRAFQDMFPAAAFENMNHDHEFEVGGAPVYDPQELRNNNYSGVGFVQDPRELINGVNGFFHGARELENTNGVGIAAGPVDNPQRLQYNNHHGVVTQIGGSFVNDPRELIMNRNHNGVEFGSAIGFVHGTQQLENDIGVQFAAGPVHVDPPVLQNYNHNGAGLAIGGRLIHDPRDLKNHHGVGFGASGSGLVHGPRELEKENVGFAAGPSHNPQLQNNIHNGVGFHIGGGFIHDPRQLNKINHNGLGYGIVSGLVREPENMNSVGYTGGFVYNPSPNNGPILPDVAFGPRRGYVETNQRNLRKSQGSEMENTRNPISQDELSVLLSGLNISKEEDDVPDDDKTVFLTFSKGYPITEPEIWGYFTRKFGNFIKAIYLEEKPEGEQPLYARMVARNPSILPLICDVTIRTKYVINGKHVWAKKFVRKNKAPTPPRSSSSSR